MLKETRRDFLKSSIHRIELFESGLNDLGTIRSNLLLDRGYPPLPTLDDSRLLTESAKLEKQLRNALEQYGLRALALKYFKPEAHDALTVSKDPLTDVIQLMARKFSWDNYPHLKPKPEEDSAMKEYKETTLKSVLTIAEGYSRDVQMRKQPKIAQEYDRVMLSSGYQGQNFSVESAFNDHLPLFEFRIAQGLTLQIGGMSLRGLIEKEPSDPSLPAYRFLVESKVMEGDPKYYSKAMQESWHGMAAQYPQIALRILINTSFNLENLRDLDAEHIDKIAKFFDPKFRYPSPAPNLAPIKKLLRNIEQVRQQAGNIIMDPTHPDFDSYSEALTEYFLHGEATTAYALATARLVGNRDTLKRTYRRAQHLAQAGIKPEFFRLMTDSIWDVVSEPNISMHTEVDLLSILKSDTPPADPPSPTWSDLGQIVNGIVENRSVKAVEFPISSESFEEVGLVPTEDAILRFQPAKPRLFSITLVYKNDKGEDDVYRLDFDTSKDAKINFDWNVMEDPDQLKSYKDMFFRFARVVLEKEKAAAILLKSQRKQLEEARLSNHGVTHAPRETGQDKPFIHQQKMKDERTKKRDQISTLTDTERSFISSVAKKPKEIRTRVELPEGITLDDLFPGVPEHIRRRLQRTMERNNANGDFDIIPLTDVPGPNGSRIYRIRIGSYRLNAYKKEEGTVTGDGQAIYTAFEGKKRDKNTYKPRN